MIKYKTKVKRFFSYHGVDTHVMLPEDSEFVAGEEVMVTVKKYKAENVTSKERLCKLIRQAYSDWVRHSDKIGLVDFISQSLLKKGVQL